MNKESSEYWFPNHTSHLSCRNGLSPCEKVAIGGVGHKTIHVLNGLDDVYAHPTRRSVCKWDVCASDALFRSMGFHLTDIDGKEYVYDTMTEHSVNGIIATNSKLILDKVVSLMSKIG